MSNLRKFRRIAKDILDQFGADYRLDPNTAVEVLKVRLGNERVIVQRYVRGLLRTRYPGVIV